MIVETILLGASAAITGQMRTDLAKELVFNLTSGSIERGIDELLQRISPERNHDFMRAVAAAMRKATLELLVLKEGWRQVFWTDSDRAIWQDLGRDADKLFVEEFGEPQKAVRNALLVGTVESIGEALEGVVAPYFEECKAREPQELKLIFPPIFLHAFEQIIKDEKHEKGWKAFHRDLAWAMHQQLIALNQGHSEILMQLQAMHEGRVELPDIIQELSKQAEKMVAITIQAITEDGEKTRQQIDKYQGLTKEQLDEVISTLKLLIGMSVRQELPFTVSLQIRLEELRRNAQISDIPFRTTDILICVASEGAAYCARCCALVWPDDPRRLTRIVLELKRRQMEGDRARGNHYQTFVWEEHDDIIGARSKAFAESASSINDRHVLLSVLMGNSNTARHLREGIGESDFSTLLQTLKIEPVDQDLGPTPL